MGFSCCVGDSSSKWVSSQACMLNIVKQFFCLSKIQTRFAVLLKNPSTSDWQMFLVTAQDCYKCCLFAIFEYYVTKLSVNELFEII